MHLFDLLTCSVPPPAPCPQWEHQTALELNHGGSHLSWSSEEAVIIHVCVLLSQPDGPAQCFLHEGVKKRKTLIHFTAALLSVLEEKVLINQNRQNKCSG
jgi:hypothetical protein